MTTVEIISKCFCYFLMWFYRFLPGFAFLVILGLTKVPFGDYLFF